MLELDEGVEKGEIFSQMKDEFGTRNEKLMAIIVGFSLSTTTKKANQQLVYLLTGLHLICTGFFVLSTYYHFIQFGGGLVFFIAGGIMFLLYGMILNNLLQYKLQVLSSIIIVYAIALYSLVKEINGPSHGIWIYAYMVFMIIGVLLSFYLRKKLFPKLGFFRPKKDAYGNYTF